MRLGILVVVIGLLAASAGADPINYTQIPAEATGYWHGDFDRMFSCRLIEMAAPEDRKQFAAGMEDVVGGPLKSITGYTVGRDDALVLLLHASGQQFHQHVEAARSKDAVVFTYDRQEVHYSSSCLLPEVYGNGAKADSSGREPQNYLTVGLGGGDAGFQGSFYTAYVGRDLIVTTPDLRAMAVALDVLSGKKPSLATEDPHGLKAAAPAGVMVWGAGLSAQWMGGNVAGDKTGSTTRPVKVGDSGASGFGMDLFGSFKGKARLARFDAGENEESDYGDATFAMVDANSAEQLKNLLLGVKALVSLSQTKARPFIDPFAVEVAGNNVVLHWSMPTMKLVELIRQAREQADENSLPTAIPASQPIH